MQPAGRVGHSARRRHASTRRGLAAQRRAPVLRFSQSSLCAVDTRTCHVVGVANGPRLVHAQLADLRGRLRPAWSAAGDRAVEWRRHFSSRAHPAALDPGSTPGHPGKHRGGPRQPWLRLEHHLATSNRALLGRSRRLPLHRRRTAPADRRGRAPGHASRYATPRRLRTHLHMPERKRILIVDDEDDIREVAQVSLELVGQYEVVTASSGRDGLARARTIQPDAILLDVMMPDLDGPSTLAQLRADPVTRHIPVVFLTAKTQQADRARLAQLGAAGILVKPFDPLKLPAEIAAALRWT